MKAKKIQNQIISINYASKLVIALMMALPSFKAMSFEYQSYELKIKNNYMLRSAVDKLPKNDLENSLRDFVASGRPNRLVGTPGHKKAQEYLEAKLKSLNKNATTTKFEFGEGGVNFVWEKKGITSPDDVIIITANYDTLIRDAKTKKAILKGEMPGADNNASGVAAMLSMMEIFNKLDLPKTVKMVFLDYGESESLGAKNFVASSEFIKEKASKKIVGVINLTMLAHDTRAADKDKKMNNMNLYTRPKSEEGFALDEAFAQRLMKAGKENYSTVTFSMTEPTEESQLPLDGNIFRGAGLPSVTFSQNREGDLNPRYMTSNDFPETLNINTYNNVFRYVTCAVLAWNYDVVK